MHFDNGAPRGDNLCDANGVKHDGSGENFRRSTLFQLAREVGERVQERCIRHMYVLYNGQSARRYDEASNFGESSPPQAESKHGVIYPSLTSESRFETHHSRHTSGV